MPATLQRHSLAMSLVRFAMLAFVLAVVPLCAHSQAMPPVNYTIPATTYGPAFTAPAMIAHLNTTYYGSSLPSLDLSWPVIRMAGVITLSGQYNTYATFMPQVYSFMVDMINAKGGVVVDGVPHLLSITWASDDSSTPLLLHLYQQWMNDPQYSIFLAPSQDPQLVALNSLILGSNRTFFNLLASDLNDFTARYPYVFTLLTSRDQVPVPSVAALNQIAQQYHSDVKDGLKQLGYEGQTTSEWGIQNMCMYVHQDSAQVLSCGGIRAWVNATNVQRAAAGATADELIVIEQDVLWNIASTGVDQNLYTATMNLCPDHVDVLVVCGQTSNPDAAAVAAALAATHLRPKAAFTTSTMPAYTVSNATMALQWTGWTSLGSFPAKPASLPGPPTWSTLSTFSRDWATYFNVSVSSLSTITVLYPSAFEIVKAALNVTQSLSSDDLRTAFLSLEGNTYLRDVRFNNLTGINGASIAALAQVQLQSGLTVPSNVSMIVYPYNWPWTRVQVGDKLLVSQTATNIIIGWVLVMLGCWVAQIIVEQAVFVRRRGGWYKLWLGLVSISLGGAGVWCSQWTMSSAVSLTKPGDSSPLPMSFSLDMAILAVLEAVILTWCGLYVLMRDVEDNSTEAVGKHNSTAHIARQINKEQRADKRKRAALSHRAHFYHLKDCMSRNVVGGSILIAFAIGMSRVTLWYNWSVQATLVSAAAGWIVSVIVAIVLLLPALLMYFHALKLRTLAVFALAGVVIIDWQVHVYTMTFMYALDVYGTPSDLYTVLLSSTAVSIITGIITAVTCFGFIGLQFSRMQLSRNGLSVLVASLENVINKQKAALTEEQHQSGHLRLQADELVRMLEAINIVRPIPKEYAWALASCSNTSTFRQQVEHCTTQQPMDKLAAPTTTHSTPIVAARSPLTVNGSLASRSNNGGTGSVTAGKATAIIALLQKDTDSSSIDDEQPSERDQPMPLASPPRSMNASPLLGAATIASTTVSQLSPSPTGSRASSVASDNPVLSVNSSALKVGWTETSTVAKRLSTGDSGEEVEAGSETVVTELRKGRGSIVSTRSSHATCEVAPLSPPGRSAISPSHSMASAKTVTRDSMPRQSHAGQDTRADIEPSKTSTSANSLSVSAQATQIDHHSRCKQFESDLCHLLHQQAQHATVAALEHPHVADNSRASVSISIAGKGRGNQPSADDLEFTMTTALKNKPTLVELLAHPVCVELVKDELERIHSVENLVFYLHAVRYRRLQSAKARRMLATLIFDTFIAEGSSQQINISTRQRDTIQAQLKKRGDDVATPQLLREAEREVALLMETNIMKAFTATSSYRLCTLVIAAIDVDKASGRWSDERRVVAGDGDGWGDGRMSLVTAARSSQGSRKHSVDASHGPVSMDGREHVQA